MNKEKRGLPFPLKAGKVGNLNACFPTIYEKGKLELFTFRFPF